MKNKELQKLLRKNNSNSGFTLTELLVGLIMGTIVIGGLGFGLVTLLRNTQTQTAFSEARNESARALDFISDEVKRAVEIDNTSIRANGFDTTNRTVVFALNIPEVNSDVDIDEDTNLLGVDNNTTTSERIVYFLQNVNTMTGTPWQGPLVLHRWGPPLDASGEYTDEAWQVEALIDGIDDTQLANSAIQCAAGQDTTPDNPSGFYACIQDDDQDAFVEDDATADTNGDGEINELDDDDVDGIGISAQLYLTSGVDIGRDNNDTYTANTQVVARARVAPDENSNNFVSFITSYRTLGAVYGCNPTGSGTDWQMRTDFINDPRNPDSEAGNRNKRWVHQVDRQPQPIRVDITNNLEINSIPVGATNCISSGGSDAGGDVSFINESLTADGLEPVYYNDGSGNNIYTDENGVPLPSNANPIFQGEANNPTGGDVYHRVSHTIDFEDPTTYNGYSNNNSDVFVGNGSASQVLFLRPGDTVPDNPGYDADADAATTNNNQQSLREFLAAKGYLNADNTVRSIEDHKISPGNFIKTDERIVIFEVGQTDPAHPGFDRQDNIFILTNDIFAKDAPD
ncbi:MAG: type II secretion system protein [Cyanobacteria bacterium J06621_8]